MATSCAGAWRRLVRFGFQRLYHELAWAYDLVSRTVSRGQWRVWQRSSLPYLEGPRVLDLGCGTGDLLPDLAEQGWLSIGLDPSSAMLRVARGKRETSGTVDRVILLQARAQALPFLKGSLDSVVATFPTPFILDPAAQAEIRRVLAAGGRLAIVNGGRLEESDLWSWLLNRAFDLTGGRGLDRAPEAAFRGLGFALDHRMLSLGSSSVWISRGRKPEERQDRLAAL